MSPLKVQKSHFKVIDRNLSKDRPKDFELRAAQAVANHFKTDVVFQKRELGKTADLDINGVIWEIKSPTGNGKNTMSNNLKTAKSQSRNIVIDLSRTKIKPEKAAARIRDYLKKYGSRMKRILLVTKSQKIIDLFNEL